jgi:hypothetical protein
LAYLAVTKDVKDTRMLSVNFRHYSFLAGLVIAASLFGVTAASATSVLDNTPEVTESAYIPAQGPDVGGNTVTVTGTGFNQVNAVFIGKVGEAPGPNGFTVQSDTTMTVKMPAHAQGATMIQACVSGSGCTGIPRGCTYTSNEITVVAAQGSLPDDGSAGAQTIQLDTFSCPPRHPT